MLGTGMMIAGFPLVMGVARQSRREQSGAALGQVSYGVLVLLVGAIVAQMFGYL